ncbi:MAG: hypothetical protein GEU80_17480 [Dehalococcoidia bacterium]|nr:hypothetical protein [Dehalococcoidia bacterium]
MPVPVPETDNQPFWDYLRSGELRVQRCASCGQLRHPPRPACGACGSFEVEWAGMSGKGAVYSYIVSHQAVHPALADRVPFATVVVELDEGPRLTTNLVDVEPEDIEIGQRVELAPTALNDEITLPLFRARR